MAVERERESNVVIVVEIERWIVTVVMRGKREVKHNTYI